MARIDRSLALLFVLLLASGPTGHARAEVSSWMLGGSGLPWAGSDSVDVMIDFETSPTAIQPFYITPDRTVFSYLDDWSPLKWPRQLGYVE